VQRAEQWSIACSERRFIGSEATMLTLRTADDEADRCFRRAIEIAVRQEARSWNCAERMSLAAAVGKKGQARRRSRDAGRCSRNLPRDSIRVIYARRRPLARRIKGVRVALEHAADFLTHAPKEPGAFNAPLDTIGIVACGLPLSRTVNCRPAWPT